MGESTGTNMHFAKIAVMMLAILCDLGLSSTLDFESYNNDNNGQLATRLLLGLFGLQVVIQISIFLILFLAMADTFLFRVGLLIFLVKKFRGVLGMHLVYMACTGKLRGVIEGGCHSILVCWWFSELDSSSHVLLSCPITSLASHITTILISILF